MNAARAMIPTARTFTVLMIDHWDEGSNKPLILRSLLKKLCGFFCKLLLGFPLHI